MNIFFLDKDPVKAAEMYCDKHKVKMILEFAQIACTNIQLLGLVKPEDQLNFKLYKPVHKNHPSTKWAREADGNVRWFFTHALALCKVYTQCYGKVHKSQAVIEGCWGIHSKHLEDNRITEFAVAIKDFPKLNDPVETYRNYYVQDKHKFAKWKNEVPDWYIQGIKNLNNKSDVALLETTIGGR